MLDAKKKVAISSVAAAVFLTGSKLAIGLLTGSLGILSEAAHSGLDLLAAVMTWWAVSVSEKPADSKHPYGYEKIENLSALFETLLLLLTCVWIIYEAVERLFFRAPHVEVNAWSYGVVIVAIVVDFSRSRALSRVAKATRSAALEADALHFSSDIFSSLVVLGGLVSTQMGYPQADAIAALGVSLFVIWISVQLGKKALHALADSVPGDHVDRAERAALKVQGVRRVYGVRVRQAGAKHFVDLKVAVDRGASLELAHEVTRAVEDALKGTFKEADVLVHAEPDDQQSLGLTEEIFALSEREGGRAHSVEVVKTDSGLEVDMHLEWPCATDLTEAHARASALERDLVAMYPEVRIIQTHLECSRDQLPSRREVTAGHPAEVAAIERAAAGVDQVQACRNVRISEGGERWWVALTLVLPPHLSLHEAHLVATRVEVKVRAMWDKVASVIVHTEPAGG